MLFSGAIVGGLLGLVVSGTGAEAPVAKGPPLIVLDPGHGGKDLGAVRRGKVYEKDLALAFTRKVRERLEKGGIATRVTRDADEYVPLDERIHDSIRWGGSMFVSLHINQDRNKKAQGIEVYAFGKHRARRYRKWRNRLPYLPAPPRAASSVSRELADHLVRSLKTDGFRADPPERAGFYVLKNPKIPSVLIELGYLSNAEEAERLSDAAYQDKLAGAIAESLREYVARGGDVEADQQAKK
ncbi:MAG: N-acetylmuramoyl-L-alanine amidase [Elusimicrobia bacterium]|nr:N-acetylmuramoyl-L-alanine amidase [Elusimicrobiota bacterium]